MKYPANIREVAALSPDYMGFIFYPASKRFVELKEAPQIVPLVHETIKKVGVFVDAGIDVIEETIWQFKLDLVQLHGTETPEYCQKVNQSGVKIIKAFGIDEHFDFRKLESYSAVCDFILFDTRTEQHGGSGIKFDWGMLEDLKLPKPLFLSGGIGPGDADNLIGIRGIDIFAVDINSRFETGTAMKNIEQLTKFFKEIRNNEVQTRQ